MELVMELEHRQDDESPGILLTGVMDSVLWVVTLFPLSPKRATGGRVSRAAG